MNEENPNDKTPIPNSLSEVIPDLHFPVKLEPVVAEETSGAGVSTSEDAIRTSFPSSAIPASGGESVLPMVKPRLVVLRGLKIDMQYPLYPGKNYLGRTDDKPVDIDLDDQEAPDRIWCSRQHAVITFENGQLTIEDLNSLNGSFVNRSRVYPGQAKELRDNDVIQIGTVHMKVLFS